MSFFIVIGGFEPSYGSSPIVKLLLKEKRLHDMKSFSFGASDGTQLAQQSVLLGDRKPRLSVPACASFCYKTCHRQLLFNAPVHNINSISQINCSFHCVVAQSLRSPFICHWQRSIRRHPLRVQVPTYLQNKKEYRKILFFVLVRVMGLEPIRH